jgi:hypothetical protein
MCCLFAALVLLGPRAAIFLWWLFEPARWGATFDTVIWPLVGFLFVPWTTLMYVLVFPGGVDGLDWVWLGLAFLIDLMSWSGGAYGNRGRMRGPTAY